MNESFKPDPQPQGDTDVAGLLKKMLQQMSYLEKKMDLLIGQSSQRPFQEKRFSKPFRPGGFGGHSGRSQGPRGDRPRERSFDSGPRFEKPQGDRNNPSAPGAGADRGRKAFFRRKTKFGQER